MSTLFHWPMRVYYEDTDAGGIVFYANYLKFFERARTEWLREAGIEQQALAETTQVMFVVKNTAIDYHAPAKLDDLLSISVALQKLGRASVNVMQQAWRNESAGPRLLCSGSIRIGCVDMRSLRPTLIPPAVATRISLAENLREKNKPQH